MGSPLALAADPSDASLGAAHELLARARPTAVNLRWALDRVAARVRPLAPKSRAQAAYAEAKAICDEDVAINEGIGRHGVKLIEAIAKRRSPARRSTSSPIAMPAGSPPSIAARR